MAEAEKRMREDDFISDKMLLMGGDEFGDEADVIGTYPRGGGMAGGRLRGEYTVVLSLSLSLSHFHPHVSIIIQMSLE